ncbi:MAG: glycosyltransferase family A protein [Candidatus Cloacimonadota bacterium]|nr:glycosyltransferase family A protein [Candidatus Cloacimonadota bacterium]
MKKVSVIIPTYNCPYLGEAIESVLTQTYKNIEIIIVDDGTTNNLKISLEKYKNRIKYLYQENSGPAAARNLGMKNATGDYIAFLDADDIWLPEKVEKQLAIFEENSDFGFAYCDNYFITKTGKTIENYIRKVKLVKGDILLDFFLDFFLITSGIILKRECLEKTGLFDEQLPVGEDFEFFLRLCRHYKAGVVKKKLYNRRVWQESLSKQDYELNKKIDIETLKKFISVNPAFYKKYRKVIRKRMADLYFKFGYAYRMHGENLKAYFQFVNSLKCGFNFKAFKNVVLCLVPCGFRRQ